ncbi:MAG: OB-fold nucleic acid binding domain-containing protein [Acidobacteria bacterium]|nr:OB-fold nucleic acid binding domain-containing protein [Acidobacteriota bacterium]
MGLLRRVFGRLGEDESERRAAAIRQWAGSLPGVTPIATAAPRTVARVAGVVETIRVLPREGVPAIEAVVGDGTGSVTAIWLGRRSLPGLTLGTRIVLEGRLGGDPRALQIMNPHYDFSAPAGG